MRDIGRKIGREKCTRGLRKRATKNREREWERYVGNYKERWQIQRKI